MYDALGLGIPHHVQSFFARIRDFATLRGTRAVTVDDVRHVYRTGLLGPSGQNDLVHYETRLKDGLDDETFSIAMEILAEAATRNVFTPRARRCLERQYEALVADIRGRVADAIEVLMHDGYIEDSENGYRFPSRLLQDWFAGALPGSPRTSGEPVLRPAGRSLKTDERPPHPHHPQVQPGPAPVGRGDQGAVRGPPSRTRPLAR